MLPALDAHHCSTDPTHLALRLSYPDGSFYIRRLPIADLETGGESVTIYAPPGDDVMLYAVGIRYDPTFDTYFDINSPTEQVNLFVSGFRAELGTIREGERKRVEVNLSALAPVGFTWREEGSEPYDAAINRGDHPTDGLAFALHVPWLAAGATDFDPQGPQVFVSNGYENSTGSWESTLGTGGWGTPFPRHSSGSGDLSGIHQVHVGSIYVRGINFGYQESIRFFMAESTCAPSEDTVVEADFGI